MPATLAAPEAGGHFPAGPGISATWPHGLSMDDRAGLLIAHPGHELRAYGWLKHVRPLVSVLTDGSGSRRQSRLPETRRLLEGVGALAGPLFGVATDRQLYDHLRDCRWDWFAGLVDRLADSWAAHGIRYVVCDAADGYNSGHDVCRLVAACAARVCGARLFELPLTERPDECSPALAPRSIWVRLDPLELAEKLATARAYAALAAELQTALETFGSASFRVECLRATEAALDLTDVLPVDPWYERYGAQQVQAGHYSRVITAAACARQGLHLDAYGLGVGRETSAPQQLLPRYDLVFAKARCALEAMAVGAAVILFGANGLGPLVTTGEFDRLRRLNFGIRSQDRPIEVPQILQQIARYDAQDAQAVSARARAEADKDRVVREIVKVYRLAIEDQAQAADDPAAERSQAAAYLRQAAPLFYSAHQAIKEAQVLRKKVVQLRAQRDKALVQRDKAVAQRDQAQAQAARLRGLPVVRQGIAVRRWLRQIRRGRAA